ncbi:MAG: hypothetical protein FWC77_05145 [Defluviitaleaceae bacterium]|nr:hypothetical protein [Defluviitaleaceae bacterium]
MSPGRFKFLNVLRGNTVNIIRPFILANIGLFVIVSVIWLYPSLSSGLDAREALNRGRQTYAAYRAQVYEYPVLHISYPSHRVLPYEYLATTMYEVQNMARNYGLESTLFTSSEPVGYDAIEGEHFVEIRVIAAFTGPEYGAVIFTNNLADSAVFIRNLQMDFLDDGFATLRVEFSLFGRRD